MQDKPKFIFNHGTGKFEGLTPEDDVKIEDLKNEIANIKDVISRSSSGWE